MLKTAKIIVQNTKLLFVITDNTAAKNDSSATTFSSEPLSKDNNNKAKIPPPVAPKPKLINVKFNQIKISLQY